MKAIFKIFFYIIKNNPWYSWPWRFLQAFTYQLTKRWAQTIYTKKLFNGKKIFLFPQSPVSSAFVYAPYPDQKEIRLLRALADDKTIFIDVGANIGAYSILLADKVKAAYAFEAHPETANCCKMNFLLNQLPESYVVTMALSNTCEDKYFSNFTHASPINSLVKTSENAIKVPAITLDHFSMQQQFDPTLNYLLKVDVEGFEWEVLQGARDFLQNFSVKGILLEAFDDQPTPLTAWLQELGYRTQYLGNNNMLAYRDK